MTELAYCSIAGVKGRAQLRALRDALIADQQAIHAEMDGLIVASKLAGSSIYLQKHWAKSGNKNVGNWRLRWRTFIGGKHEHALWPDLTEILSQLPVAVVQHYEHVNRRSLELNLLDLMVQTQISYVERYLGLRGKGASID